MITVDVGKGLIGIIEGFSLEMRKYLIIHEPYKDSSGGELAPSQRTHNRYVPARRATVKYYLHKVQ